MQAVSSALARVATKLAALPPIGHYALLCFAVGVIADLVRRHFLLSRLSFADKHVIVTGGSQGIGKALAAKLLARGARVTLLARTEKTLAAAAAELRAGAGGEPMVQYVCASTIEQAQLDAAVAKASKEYGPADCLIACAGGALPGLFLQTEAETYASTMNLNYMGTLRSIKAVVEP